MMRPGMVSPCEELLQYGGQGLRDDVMGLTGEGAVCSVGKGSGERLRRVKPESVRTNCREASRISSSVALGLEIEQRLDVAAHGCLCDSMLCDDGPHPIIIVHPF